MPRSDRAFRVSLIVASATFLLCLAMPAAAESEAGRPTAAEQLIQMASVEVASAAAPTGASNLVLEDNQGYNPDYIFGMTKGVANSTIHDAVKPVLMLFTIPLDLAFLPFAAIGGLFG